jgi:hypothetical protein
MNRRHLFFKLALCQPLIYEYNMYTFPSCEIMAMPEGILVAIGALGSVTNHPDASGVGGAAKDPTTVIVFVLGVAVSTV